MVPVPVPGFDPTNPNFAATSVGENLTSVAVTAMHIAGQNLQTMLVQVCQLMQLKSQLTKHVQEASDCMNRSLEALRDLVVQKELEEEIQKQEMYLEVPMNEKGRT